MDRGYNDYKLYAQWTDNNIYFVTRLKDNADFVVIAEQKVPKNRNILADQLIIFSWYYSNKDRSHVLRRVVVWDIEKDKEIVLLTNILILALPPYRISTKTDGKLSSFSRLLNKI